MSRKLMIQGTMSGAGKSLLTAGILRALVRRGFPGGDQPERR